ncbi:MAG: efflux RND transporter permease subunit [Proteobacteria bacterium]|nr:efflux RND transporter permease subunit [Pseudomonadota bacterium]
MSALIRGCAEKSRASILFLVIVCIAGYFAYLNIPKESNPDVKVPIIYVLVTYEGVSPEDGERLMARPLENELRSVEGINEITSYANEGSVSVIMEFDAGFDSNKALQDVRDKVNDTRNKLPKDADMPEVHEINLSLEPVLNVVLSGDIPRRTLVTLAREIAEQIEAVPEVLSVNIGGDREEVVEIEITPKALESYGLSADLMRSVVDSNNQLIPAGSIRTSHGEYSIKVPSLVRNLEELLDFPIKIDGDSIVRLRDVATVKNTYKEGLNEARVNSKPAVVLEIAKRTGQNIISTVNAIKAILAEQAEYLPDKIEIFYTQDRSDNIMDMVKELENSIILGVLLVMAVIIIAVGYKSAVLIAFSIPASFFAGILVLSLTGLTLNVVVLFSLILTVGMIVDDAIVVSEYADRKMIEGEHPSSAFMTSAERMLWPVFTSTLVKIIVFMPLLFWPGIIGQFMKYMPITVIVILTGSLVFALLIQPALGPLLGKNSEISEEETLSMKAAEDGHLENLVGWTKQYAQTLTRVLERPWTFVLSILGLGVATYVAFAMLGLGSEFFPKVEPNSAMLIIQSPGNLALEQRDALVKQVEERLKPFANEVETFYAKSGNFDQENNLPKGTIGTIHLGLVDWDKRRKADVILADMLEKLSDIQGIVIQTFQERMGPPARKPLEFDLTARDTNVLSNAADKALAFMKTMEGLYDLEDSRPQRAVEWQVIVDRAKAARYNVDINSIGQNIRLVSTGLIVSSYRPDYLTDEVDISVRFAPQDRGITALQSLKVMNRSGLAVPISNFASIRPAPKVGEIKRVNRKAVITLSANVAPGVLVNNKVEELKQWLKSNPELGVEVIFRGDEKEQMKTMHFLSNAFLCALGMMFMTMLVQFNSFYHTLIIMSAIFLSTVGVLLGLLIAGQPFGIVMSGVGIIALAGIVLNNNILFIDTYQRLRKSGIDVHKAVIMAGIQRVRPIVLTALTAILGLVPMAIGFSLDFYSREFVYGAPASALWQQLATSITGGLAFATVLTLFFTPCLLIIGQRFDIKPDQPSSTRGANANSG